MRSRNDTDTADERAGTSTGSAGERAQTSIDFVVGASVFLLTVASVAAFLPGAFEPFTDDGTDDVVVADRTADLLAEQLLAEPTEPGVLNATDTAEFFDDTTDLHAALGLDSGTGVEVTVEGDGTVWHSAGSEPPDDESVVVSRRVVLLDGEKRDLYVRVW